MINLFTPNISRDITKRCIDMKNMLSDLQRSAARIGFINKALKIILY